MEINFNNIRKQACVAYDNLCSKMNDEIDDGYLKLPVSFIQKEMDVLRVIIGAIAMCSEKGNSDITDVFSELYGDNGSMKLFNENTTEV
jgi:hypothetical protein